MRLWTIQPPDVYDLIIKDGYFICDDTKSSMLQRTRFRFAYDWLVDQMTKRIGNAPENVTYPVWAYLRKPNLDKQFNTENPGTRVCIEFEIDEKDILVTNLNWWSITALNFAPYIKAKTAEEFDEKYDRFEALPVEQQTAEMLKSWEMLIIPVSYSGPDEPQATFWKLNADQIINVTFFEQKGEWIFDEE